jgi:ergothioneine biosynthesis protein EgtB
MTEPVPTSRLIDMMTSARRRTLELVQGLTPDQFIGPKLPTLNPLIWEIGHVGWFYENFILRRLYSQEPMLATGDALYDSIAIAHETRWDLPVLPLSEILAYMQDVQDALIDRLGNKDIADERHSYLYQFTVFHEDMHTEAFTWARQTLGYPTPVFEGGPVDLGVPDTGSLAGDVVIMGGTFLMGAEKDAPFLFDNEKWARPVTVAPFKMARAPVTNREFADFVADGGYQKYRFWDANGWTWRQEAAAEHPIYWVPDEHGGWGVRRFDQVVDLPLDQPVIHVCWHEANAYCRWAGRRLPTEAEWELGATTVPETTDGVLQKRRYPWGDEEPTPDRANLDGFTLGCVDVAAHSAGDSVYGCRQMVGNVWEWTADVFKPFPGFAPDDYKEYSQPLFDSTRVLRGGAWTTRGRMISALYRNYFGSDRRDVFAGFRTCAAAD